MAVFLVVALLYKVALMQPAATGRILLAVAQNDAAIVALLLLLYAAAVAAARYGAQWAGSGIAKLCMLLCLLVTFVYAADVFAYFFFATRLYASDVVTFSFELDAAVSLLKSGYWVARAAPLWKIGMAVGVCLILICASVALLLRPVRPGVRARHPFAAALVMLGIYLVPVPSYVYSFVDKPLYENYIERNANFFFPANFSDAYRARLLHSPLQPRISHPGRGRPLDVIVLIVESLSSYHSDYFSGIEDWTPMLDRIARRETALTNLHANGWTTIGGLIATLTGTFPFVPERTAFNDWGSPRLTDFMDVPRPLPRMLLDYGYATEFVSAGDLGFLEQDRWLEAIGYQKLVGHRDPRFDAQVVRGPFHSVPDRLLYEVALDELGNMPTDRPRFMTIQTWWSHRPFMAPDGSRLHGEEQVVRETDRQLGVLYERLAAIGFFDHGLLFIVGDHRAMEPFQKAEFERFGRSAVARVPAVVATDAIELPPRLEENFQQRDLAASIEALIAPSYSLQPYQGAFFADPVVAPSCIMHARGDDRDLIFVRCGTQEATVRVDGDETRVVDGHVDDAAAIIETINLTRLRAQQGT